MRTAALLVAALTLMGCGTETGSAPASSDPGGDHRVAPHGRTQLTVVVRSGGGDAKRTFSLTCDPPGGDHPHPEAACRLLEGLSRPFAPVPADQACTELYGGPQTARVTGTLYGEPVDTRFDRTDGCQTDRWEVYTVLLVERGGAA